MNQSLKKFASGDGDQYLQELDIIGTLEATHNIPISDDGTSRLNRFELGSLFVAAGLDGGQTVYGGTGDGDGLIIRSSSGVLGEIEVYGSSIELFVGSERFLWGGDGNGVFVGRSAGVVGYGGFNVGVGRQSLAGLSGGDLNVGVGYRSLFGLTGGGDNVGVGYGALSSLIGGNDNVGVGYNVGSGGSNISDCVIIGSGARSGGASDTNSVVIGYGSVGLGSNSVVLGNSSITKSRLFGDVGVGVDSATAGVHVVKAGEQLRLGYDSANYLSVSVGSTGVVSFIPSAGPIQFSSANNSPSIGSELVVDGDFSSGSNWTKGSGWAVSGGVASCDGSSGVLSQNKTGLVNGRNYHVSFTVNKTSGSLNVSLGSSGVVSSWPASAGVNNFEGSVICRNTSALLSFTSNSFIGSVDNVSLKLISNATPALSLYNSSPVGDIAFRADSSSVGIGGGGLQIINTTQYNSLFGANAGYNVSYGRYNVGLGTSAQFRLTYGDDNVAIGYQAQCGNYGGFSGDKNIGVGTNAQYSMLFGNDNVAIGYQSQYILTSGNKNVGVGNYSLTTLTTGGGNVAVGDNAAGSLITGSNNICVGYQANVNASSDTNSIVIGYGSVGLGSNSVVLGNSSITKTRLYGNVGVASGANAVADTPSALIHVIGTGEQLRLGYDIGNYLSVSVGSTGVIGFDAVGSGSSFSFNDGLSVTAVSEQLRLRYNLFNYLSIGVSSHGAVTFNAVGTGGLSAPVFFDFRQPLLVSSGSDNWFYVDGNIGSFNVPVLIKSDSANQLKVQHDLSNYLFVDISSSGKTTFNSVGSDSCFEFLDAIKVLASGEQLRLSNDVSNYLAIAVSSAGVVGFNATGSNPSFSFNNTISLIGTGSARAISMGSDRFIHNYGSYNTFVGVNAGNFTLTGEYNTGIGSAVCRDIVTGSRNTGIGFGSLSSITTSSNNVAIGYYVLEMCGNNNIGIGNTTGSSAAHNNCVFIGHNVEVGFNNWINAIVIGYNASALDDNSVVLGNSAITKTRLRGGVGIGGDPYASTDGNLQIIGVGGTKRVTISVDVSSKLINFLGSDLDLSFYFLNNAHFNGLSTGDINAPDVGITQDIQVSVPSGTRTLSFKNGLLIGVATP